MEIVYITNKYNEKKDLGGMGTLTVFITRYDCPFSSISAGRLYC